MAITLNTNFGIAAPNPIDDRYLSTRTSGGRQLPYSGTSEVFLTLPESRRYPGLTVLIDTGTTATEWWFREGVADLDLIPKTIDIDIPQGDFITGATNIGYFEGFTGVQRLNIASSISYPFYDGYYNSVYNYYFRGSDQKICIGTPSDGIPKRGYVKDGNTVSWIWNDYAGGADLKGWIFVNGDVTDLLGTTPSVQVYYNGTTTFPYTASTWTTFCNNGSQANIVATFGSTTTGDTIAIGARPYAYESSNRLHFRTVISDTPSIINVSDDSTFIRISGATPIFTGANIGSGTGVVLRTPVTGTTLNFRTLRGSGDTIITTVGNEIVIYAGVSGQTSITGGTNIGFSGGTGIFAGNDNKTMQFRSIVGSGDTVVTQSGDTVVIFTDAGEQTYNLASPSVIPLGGICSGTVLTGKTAFELFEELLVPELFPNFPFTAPSTTTTLYSGVNVIPNNALYEIGCPIGVITVCSSFSRGAITPQYCSASPFRSGNANCYVFTGTDVSGSYAVTGTSMSCNTLSYTILQGSVNTWGTNTCYDAGVQPKGSKGTDFCTPLSAGQTSTSNRTIIGAYPLFGTCVNLTTLTCVHLCNMATANCVQITLVPEDGVNKQKFEIPCAWLTSRPLVGVQDYNCLNGCWEYGSGGLCGLNYYCSCSVNKTIQGNSINYAQYSHCCGTRGIACIRLIF